ncbi:hypothetical protein CZ774_13370 [Frigoribacterium sp. JB110]|nr:hypothetical protein CZ774_13370 [Frigoribacterium sp. JB110]
MHLPLRAQGTTLTEEQAKMLDDEFFRSNPPGCQTLTHRGATVGHDLAAEPHR